MDTNKEGAWVDSIGTGPFYTTLGGWNYASNAGDRTTTTRTLKFNSSKVVPLSDETKVVCLGLSCLIRLRWGISGQIQFHGRYDEGGGGTVLNVLRGVFAGKDLQNNFVNGSSLFNPDSISYGIEDFDSSRVAPKGIENASVTIPMTCLLRLSWVGQIQACAMAGLRLLSVWQEMTQIIARGGIFCLHWTEMNPNSVHHPWLSFFRNSLYHCHLYHTHQDPWDTSEAYAVRKCLK